MIALLTGCATSSSPLADVLAAAFSDKFGPGKAASLADNLNPQYDYLWGEVEDHPPVLLVLGYIDAHPQGDIEVWYSAKHEVIKIQNGRIVATTGLQTDWRAVRFPSSLPVWSDVPPQGEVYQRFRDEMPGHRYAISDRIELKPWHGVPPITLPDSLPPEQARAYGWFQETTLSTTAQPLPPAWFAWGTYRGQPAVVYSEQCLSPTFCLKLQRWPVQNLAL